MVLFLLALVLVGAGSFYGGIQYQKSQRSGFPGGQFPERFNGTNLRGRSGPNGVRGWFRPVSGEVLKTDDTSITVKMPDGSSKIVMISDSTKINKAAEGSMTDITVGSTVMVLGMENSDGSVTAQNIQLNPILRVPTTTQ